MLNRLLANKKIVIIAIALFLAACVGAVILITPSSKETGGKGTDSKTEQGKEDNKDNEEDNTGLEVLKPGQTSPENSSDASGSWGDTPQSNPQTGDTGNKIDKTENEKPNEEDKKDDGEEPEKDEDEDILEDDISWGNIY